LFFGDVEPDSLSANPRTRQVWQAAAPKIVQGSLDTIFLECSWRSTRQAKELYGHLSPPYVIEELRSLATEVVSLKKRPKTQPSRLSSLLSSFSFRSSAPKNPSLSADELVGSLKGVTLVIIHCKASTETFPEGQTIEDIILTEVQSLAEAERLGVTITVARQGAKLGMCATQPNSPGL
jgi:cAMP phosphodiesterase